jgi:hypothetical protein
MLLASPLVESPEQMKYYTDTETKPPHITLLLQRAPSFFFLLYSNHDELLQTALSDVSIFSNHSNTLYLRNAQIPSATPSPSPTQKKKKLS